jgi:hypothetical protein
VVLWVTSGFVVKRLVVVVVMVTKPPESCSPPFDGSHVIRLVHGKRANLILNVTKTLKEAN